MKPLIVCIILGQFIVLTHVSIVFAILKDNSVRVLQLVLNVPTIISCFTNLSVQNIISTISIYSDMNTLLCH